jgi:hypothetical protein
MLIEAKGAPVPCNPLCLRRLCCTVACVLRDCEYIYSPEAWPRVRVPHAGGCECAGVRF